MTASALAERLDSIQHRASINAVEVAQMLNTSPETISRWRNGRVEPRATGRDRLLKLGWLVEQLSELYTPNEAHLWLFSPHKMLGGATPVEVIKQGKIEKILDIIAQLKDGAYV